MNVSSLGPGAPTLTVDGVTFRDLNKNGRLDPYEDSRRPIEERVEDLLSQMSLEEKAGMMFHTMIGMNQDGTLLEGAGAFGPVQTSDLVAKRLINHFYRGRAGDHRSKMLGGRAFECGRTGQKSPRRGRGSVRR